MGRRSVKFLLAIVLTVAVIFSSVSCSFLGIRTLSMEFSLTDEDYDYFERKAFALFEDAKNESSYLKVIFDLNGFSDSYSFIIAEAKVAYINYCKNTKSARAISDYKYANALSYKARELYTETIRNILELENSVTEMLFSEWSEEEKENLLSYNSEVESYLERNELILMDLQSLDSDAEDWRERADSLYLEFFDNNRAIAELDGYDNYYDYATEMIHLRDYSFDERTAFREYVRSYIAPLYKDVKEQRRDAFDSADDMLKREYDALANCNYDENQWDTDYILDYIDQYESDLEFYLMNMFNSEGMVIGDGEDALDTAFTTFLNYYGEPVVFFGKGYRNMFTVVHENGHYAAMWQPEIFSQCLDVHEIHSQGNEWMFVEYLDGKIDPKLYEMLMLDRLMRGLGNIITACAVDEMEEMIYRGEAKSVAEAANIVSASYEGSFEKPDAIGDYFRHVAMASPVYYISYATSELVSIGLYTIANDDYTSAMDVYSRLVLEIDGYEGLLGAVNYCGLLDPFSEETFKYMTELFSDEDVGTEDVPSVDAAA